LVFQVVSFPQVSSTESCMHLSCLPYVPHAPPISFFFVCSREYCSLYTEWSKRLCASDDYNTAGISNTNITTNVFLSSLLGSICLAPDRQDQGDTRLRLTPSVIPNCNYVIMVSDWNCLKYFCVFLYCNHQVHRDFLITLYKYKCINSAFNCHC
jgi:hypothetical protein